MCPTQFPLHALSCLRRRLPGLETVAFSFPLYKCPHLLVHYSILPRFVCFSLAIHLNRKHVFLSPPPLSSLFKPFQVHLNPCESSLQLFCYFLSSNHNFCGSCLMMHTYLPASKISRALIHLAFVYTNMICL